ncbi:MAG: hypothetical protein FJX77_08245 [Armatimonadetes bacterium]|nr:hypothetical protein [Armatimonadota bacterium]
MPRQSRIPIPAHQRYDQACRFAAHTDPVGVLAWVTDAAPTAFRFCRWLNDRSVPEPGDPERISDTIAEVAATIAPRSRIACVLEFQSRPDPNIVGRLFEYLGRLFRVLRQEYGRRRPPDPLAGLVNLTGKQRVPRPRAVFPGSTRMALDFQIGVRNVATEVATTALDAMEAGRWARILLGFVPLMQGEPSRLQ